MRTAALTDKLPAATRHRISDYYALCKPRVVMLITFTAMVGMLLASPGMVDLGAALGLPAKPVQRVFAVRSESSQELERHRSPDQLGWADARLDLVFEPVRNRHVLNILQPDSINRLGSDG